MAADMRFMPSIRVAKAAMPVPMSFVRCFFPPIIMPRPTTPRIGQKFAGFISCRNRFELSMADRERSQAVTVVPMLAPMITPTACCSVMIWELTKPTTMTIVAPDD